MAETDGLGRRYWKGKAEAQVSPSCMLTLRPRAPPESHRCFFSFFTLLRLLEVGAVRPDNYRGCASWMDVTAIDLHSRHPSILEQDFLLMDPASQPEHREAWDVVSLSLVLNFVPDGKDRGKYARNCQ